MGTALSKCLVSRAAAQSDPNPPLSSWRSFFCISPQPTSVHSRTALVTLCGQAPGSLLTCLSFRSGLCILPGTQRPPSDPPAAVLPPAAPKLPLLPPLSSNSGLFLIDILTFIHEACLPFKSHNSNEFPSHPCPAQGVSVLSDAQTACAQPALCFSQGQALQVQLA